METLAIIEKLFAGAVVLVCAVLLVRQFVGARRRYRFDSVVRRVTRSVRAAVVRMYRWPAARRAARLEAEAAIRRARGQQVESDGNVYRPKFRNSRKLH